MACWVTDSPAKYSVCKVVWQQSMSRVNILHLDLIIPQKSYKNANIALHISLPILYSPMPLHFRQNCGKIFVLIKYCVQAAVDDVLGQVNTQITDIKEKVMGVIPIKSKPTVLKKEE